MSDKFTHNGFECHLTERPELCYMKQFYVKKGDRHLWPPLWFDSNVSFSEAKQLGIDFLDGCFTGIMEKIGKYNICMGKT